MDENGDCSTSKMVAHIYVGLQGHATDRETVELYLSCDHSWLSITRLGDWQWILNASVGFHQITHTSHAEILCANIQ